MVFEINIFIYMYTYIINLIYNIFLNYITISYCAFGIQMSTPREKTKIIIIALFKIKKNNLYFLVLYTYLVFQIIVISFLNNV